jgi:hypothetical protein
MGLYGCCVDKLQIESPHADGRLALCYWSMRLHAWAVYSTAPTKLAMDYELGWRCWCTAALALLL